MSSSTISSTKLFRGVLLENLPATATKPAHVVVTVAGSNYQLHLVPSTQMNTEPGKRVVGEVRLEARRIDKSQQGGKFVEPLFGRPRRVQGVVIEHDISNNSIVVDAGGAIAVDGLPMPIVLKLTDERQKPDMFPLGTLVGCDVRDGGTFVPAR